jgi:cytochrome d ubiquinol oxidase subunit I
MWLFDATLLSRIQFAFVVSFHIIFPSFTIGLAAGLAVMEAVSLRTGSPVHRRVFDFWLRVFAIAFGMGVVSGIVMAFQFGTNWSGLARQTGSIQGPLLGYETFTAFLLEATFLGVVLFGRERVPPWFYLLSCVLVAVGTLFSSFWILVNNSWMQVPLGHTIVNGRILPDDWLAILFGPVQRVRWPHMVLACFITTSASIVSTACWWLLQGRHRKEAVVCLRWALGLLAVLTPLQFAVGHFAGMVVHDYQPAKFAAIEARFQTQQPASEVLVAWPDAETGTNRFALEVPRLGSFIASGTWTSREVGLDTFPPQDRPPVLVPFFGFRLMVGMGLLLLGLAWVGVVLALQRGALERARWFQVIGLACFPAGFLAVLAGWFTAEVGRQPWVVYGLLRTRDAVTPSLAAPDVILSLAVYVAAYAFIYSFGVGYIVRLLRAGPRDDIDVPATATAKRPMALAAAGAAEE